MKFKEVEFKYSAEFISLSSFERFCNRRSPKAVKTPAGYDHFYHHNTNDGAFCRLRSGADMHQLTFKRKTVDTDSFIRTEHNIDLKRTVSKDQLDALLTEFGYSFNKSIYKNCFVYEYDWYTLVYYIVYNLDMKELGRFVEIEMNEAAPWESEDAAWNELLVIEKLCRPLGGISPQLRIKENLFEMYREPKVA